MAAFELCINAVYILRAALLVGAFSRQPYSAGSAFGRGFQVFTFAQRSAVVFKTVPSDMSILNLAASDVNVQELLSEMRDIKAAVLNLFQLVQSSSDLSVRVQQLEIRGMHADAETACAWVCPVCRTPFKHRESFKGHILRLKEPVAKRTKCFFDEENPVHVALLSHPRFGTGDFGSRAAAFSSQFYDRVRSCSNSSRSSESSFAAVSVVCLPPVFTV